MTARPSFDRAPLLCNNTAMKIDSGQNSSLSALKAHGKAIAATAHNVANLNTENFAPIERQFSDQNPGVKVTLSRREPTLSSEGTSGQSLSRSMVQLVGDGHAYKANLSALKSQLVLDDAILALAAKSGEAAETD